MSESTMMCDVYIVGSTYVRKVRIRVGRLPRVSVLWVIPTINMLGWCI